jgi:arabinose-5-phosphate isomerase
MKDLRTSSSMSDLAKESIISQSDALKVVASLINSSFDDAVKLIHKSKGRVIITGIGKSAIIASKIVATLNSTGTPSIFMHAADAIHGDLGLVQENDIIICISKSGNTPEIKVLLSIIKKLNNKLIAITGNLESTLASNADYIFNSYVEKEVCPNNLAPTTSTTAQLVIGDALAICLLNLKKFTKDDFAKYHPGGSLGKKLFLTVEELSSQNQLPLVKPYSNIKDVIIEISEKRLGVTAVIENDKVLGVITDGDLRRMLAISDNISNITAKEIMSKNPKTITSDSMAIEARKLMESSEISQLIVLKNNKYAGVIHIHDLIREGII